MSEPTGNATSVQSPDIGDHVDDADLGTQVTLREASGEADAYYLTRLWHHYFGIEYNHDGDRRLPAFPARIAGWTDEDQEDVYGVIASHSPPDRDGTVRVGAGLVALRDHDDAVAEMPDDCRFDREALVDDVAAYLVFGVVDPAFRGHGIGYEMFRERLEWASRHGAEMVFSFGWERDGRSSRPLFEAFDFVPIERFPDYYAENRGACPDCKSWPSNGRSCECAMTFWARDLPDGGEIA